MKSKLKNYNLDKDDLVTTGILGKNKLKIK